MGTDAQEHRANGKSDGAKPVAYAQETGAIAAAAQRDGHVARVGTKGVAGESGRRHGLDHDRDRTHGQDPGDADEPAESASPHSQSSNASSPSDRHTRPLKKMCLEKSAPSRAQREDAERDEHTHDPSKDASANGVDSESIVLDTSSEQEEQDSCSAPEPDSRLPPASYEFDAAPAPPLKVSGIALMYTQPLSRVRALVRTQYAPTLWSRALPIAIVQDDDPLDEEHITLRGVKMVVPGLFEDDERYQNIEKEIERAEVRNRGATKRLSKYKTIGGELGSISVRKRPGHRGHRRFDSNPVEYGPSKSGRYDAEDAHGGFAKTASASKHKHDSLHVSSGKLSKRPKKPVSRLVESSLLTSKSSGHKFKRGAGSSSAATSAAKAAAAAAAAAASVAAAAVADSEKLMAAAKEEKRDAEDAGAGAGTLKKSTRRSGGNSKLERAAAAAAARAAAAEAAAIAAAQKAAEAAEKAAEREEAKQRRDAEKRLKAMWKQIVRFEMPKVQRLRAGQNGLMFRTVRSRSLHASREARKNAVTTVRVADQAAARSKKLLKDVANFWKREDKERTEKKRRELAELENVRRKEEEEREAQRQKNKLRFLLGQSEAFSSFLAKKNEATIAAIGSSAVEKAAQVRAGVTGDEDDEELQRKAEEGAAALVAQHKARLEEFDAISRQKRLASETAKGNLLAVTGTGAERPATEAEADAAAGVTHNGVSAVGGKACDLSATGEDARAILDKAQEGIKQPTRLIAKMKSYQLKGLAWLVSLYDQGINGILADEMGLGKTIQTISFLAYLTETENNWGPFLVVTPKATLHNWQQELAKFCPDLKCLPYWGNKNDRLELRKVWSAKRMYRQDSEFHVCVTSYEILVVDEKHFSRVKWQYLVLDEAQAIKNSSSQRWKSLLSFPCRNRLLLTGTPLQNKLSELWSLLHFIMPTIFDSQTEFADWFAKDIEGHAAQSAGARLDATTIARLRTLLDPFMLRRVKKDVENEMPPKTEIEISTYLTPRQRLLYNGIKQNISVSELLRSLGGLSREGGANGDNSRLMNIVMQLRKVCNHPETFERRHTITPFQFQASPPPSFTPLPPAILLSSLSPVELALRVKFVSRSTIPFELPRALMEDMVFELGTCRHHYLLKRFNAWSADYSHERMFKQKGTEHPQNEWPHGHGYALARLAGGYSVGEFAKLMNTEDRLWNWHDVECPMSETLARLVDVYGDGDEPDAGDAIRAVHRMIPLIGRSRSTHPVVLPGFASPAEIVARQSRLLRTAQVFVPPASAPPVVPHCPGAGSQSIRDHTRFNERFAFPDPPDQRFSVRTYEEYRAFWQELLDLGYGMLPFFPVQLPDPGRLIVDSGKMRTLDELLNKLKAEGHKCLIYSQFVKVLDILEDYCVNAGHKHLRLDGQSGLPDRRDMVADWQSNPELFVFLLSTRAGGVGINLTAADTVIFFDSDWNPTVDAQAMDRAHRLGQERPVTVYRLIAKNTIEERILTRARQKDRIHDLVIKGQVQEIETEQDTGPSLTDVAQLLLDEEDIGMKAMLEQK
ncbi:putative DNA helicase INO80 [Porphyridium purpureum]|uniref:Chromatin-remodeling ATPase INO80 n=1 Tax=Porphyridium purpureum TaxID=35688 RepID=A0A5J4ZAF0_PORPP|nr:putative DNA helicase INO80 [Porphyridium purpureum]|eukprot:POR2910..scf295_1